MQAWDTGGTRPWTSYVIDYNSDGSVSDAQFTLKDSVQNTQTGNWMPTLTVYDSNHPTDHTVLLITEAELLEENEAQPVGAKQDVQQRVTLPDGENYLGQQAWSQETVQWNSAGVVTGVSTIGHNGVNAQVQYGADGSYTVTSTDTKNVTLWSQEIDHYDAAGALKEQDFAYHDGSALQSQYDTSGNVIFTKTINADGSYTTESIDDTGTASYSTETTAYNATNQKVEYGEVDHSGMTTVVTYNTDATSSLNSEVTYNTDKSVKTIKYYAGAGKIESARTDRADGSSEVDTYYASGALEARDTVGADGTEQYFGYQDQNSKPYITKTTLADGVSELEVIDFQAATDGSPWTQYIVDYSADGSVARERFWLTNGRDNVGDVDLYNSTNLNNSAQSLQAQMLMAEAELTEKIAAEPASAKTSATDTVKLTNGEQYYITEAPDGTFKYTSIPHPNGILNIIEEVATVVLDVAAAVTGNVGVIVAASAIGLVDGATQIAEGNDLGGVLSIIGSAAGADYALQGQLFDGTTLAWQGLTIDQAVIAGSAIGENIPSIINGIESGNVLEAVGGVVGAAGAAFVGFDAAGLGKGGVLSVEVGEAVLGTAEAAANGNIAGAVSAMLSTIGAYENYQAGTPQAPKTELAMNLGSAGIVSDVRQYTNIIVTAPPFTSGHRGRSDPGHTSHRLGDRWSCTARGRDSWSGCCGNQCYNR